MLVLIFVGNDGFDLDTITFFVMVKNVVVVGNYYNCGGGVSNIFFDVSSRGLIDDGRIKFDVIVLGSWVRSCRS